MEKYQLFECSHEKFNAGDKAPQDVRFFAEEVGFKRISFFYWGDLGGFSRLLAHARRFFEWLLLFLRVKSGSFLFMQLPLVRGGRFYRLFFLNLLKSAKKVKVITLIHDVNELRYEDSKKERLLLDEAVKVSDRLIVHNKKMADYFERERNVPPEKLIALVLFDYRTECELKSIPFEKSITIAGTLDAKKCAYLNNLSSFSDIHFHLYGKNYAESGAENITYHGQFDPADIVEQMAFGFGLVWDGNSADSCIGRYGNYLRYNNPHKLSMYLVATLPVIVWRESAVSDFVLENGVGLSVSSIREAVEKVNGLSAEDYQKMRDRCAEISKKLKCGHFTKTALSSALVDF